MSLLGRLPFVGRLFRHVDPMPADVVEFWKAITTHYGTTLVDKASSEEMKFVAEALDLMQVVDKHAFLTNYTTTIGDKIYLPFTPGTPTDAWPLWQQIVVGVHEHVHCAQSRGVGLPAFNWNYLTSPAQRAQYEAEAYRTGMVLEWRYQGQMLNPTTLAQLLMFYGCSAADIAVTEKMLALSIPAIKAGAAGSDVCRWAMTWLDARWH